MIVCDQWTCTLKLVNLLSQIVTHLQVWCTVLLCRVHLAKTSLCYFNPSGQNGARTLENSLDVALLQGGMEGLTLIDGGQSPPSSGYKGSIEDWIKETSEKAVMPETLIGEGREGVSSPTLTDGSLTYSQMVRNIMCVCVYYVYVCACVHAHVHACGCACTCVFVCCSLCIYWGQWVSNLHMSIL